MFDFLLAAATDEANGKVFNIGGDCVINLKDLAEMLIQNNSKSDYTIRSFPADRKQIDIGDYYADYSLIKSSLGWEPKVSLRDGLSLTVAFYKQHLEHYL